MVTESKGLPQEFDAALEVIAERIIRIMRQRCPSGQLPMRLQSSIEVSDDGRQVTPRYTPRPYSLWLFDSGRIADLLKDVDFASALHTIWNVGWLPVREIGDQEGKPLVPTFENSRYHNAELLITLVCELVDKEGNLNFQPSDVVQFLRNQQERWASPTILEEGIIPLLRFRTDQTPVELGGGATLGALPASEKSQFWEPTIGSIWHLSADQLRSAHGKLVKRGHRPRFGPILLLSEMLSIGSCAITALRLLKPGPIGARFVRVQDIGPVLSQSSVACPMSEFFLSELSSGECLLERSDAPRFLHLYDSLRQLQTATGFESLALSLRRFNLSYSRDQRDDKIIDMVIALEATLLFRENQELRNKLAMRGAAVLRRSRASTTAFRDFRRLYDIRSKIVHGGRTLEDLWTKNELESRGLSYHSVDDYIREVEQLVREVLVEYVQLAALGKSISEINEGLDGDLLVGLSKL